MHERDRRADESGPLATDEACAHRHVDLIHEVGRKHRCIERRSAFKLGEVALDLFERGMKLSETCRKQLEEAETRVELLTRRAGEMVPEPFDEDGK